MSFLTRIISNFSSCFKDTSDDEVKKMYKSLTDFVFSDIPENVRKFHADNLINLLKNISIIHSEDNLNTIYLNCKIEDVLRKIIDDPKYNKNYIKSMFIYTIDKNIINDPDFKCVTNAINNNLTSLDLANPIRNKPIYIDINKINTYIERYYNQNKRLCILFNDLFNDNSFSDKTMNELFGQKLLGSEIIVLRNSLKLLLFYKYFCNNKSIDPEIDSNFRYYNIRNNSLTYNHGEIFIPHLITDKDFNNGREMSIFTPALVVKLISRTQLEELINDEEMIKYYDE